MKQRIIQHLPTIIYRGLNSCLLAVGILIMLFIVRFFIAYYSNHFHYNSIVAVKEYNTIGEPLFFQNDLERFIVTDMHYEDTLRC